MKIPWPHLLILASASMTATSAPLISELAILPGSQDAGCYPVWDSFYSATAPIDTSLGIGYLLNPGPISGGAFTLHDHAYIAPHVPDPGRAVVTFRFDAPATVDQLEIVQHANGISMIEGFVGDSPGDLVSIGSVFGPDGDVTGSAYFGEGSSYVFDFDNTLAGTYFQFIVAKTSLAEGWATYRAFPRDEDGLRFDLRDTPVPPPPSTPPAIPEPGSFLAAGLAFCGGGLWVLRRRTRTRA